MAGDINVNADIVGPIADLIDELFTSDEEREMARLKLLEMQQSGRFRMFQAQLSAILAEAKSEDPWTSRARPTFLYLIYLVIFALVFVGAPLSVFYPTEVSMAAGNLERLLNAIPEYVWWLFGTGYLGYTGGRTFEKWQKAKQPKEEITWKSDRVLPKPKP